MAFEFSRAFIDEGRPGKGTTNREKREGEHGQPPIRRQGAGHRPLRSGRCCSDPYRGLEVDDADRVGAERSDLEIGPIDHDLHSQRRGKGKGWLWESVTQGCPLAQALALLSRGTPSFVQAQTGTADRAPPRSYNGALGQDCRRVLRRGKRNQGESGNSKLHHDLDINVKWMLQRCNYVDRTPRPQKTTKKKQLRDLGFASWAFGLRPHMGSI